MIILRIELLIIYWFFTLRYYSLRCNNMYIFKFTERIKCNRRVIQIYFSVKYCSIQLVFTKLGIAAFGWKWTIRFLDLFKKCIVEKRNIISCLKVSIIMILLRALFKSNAFLALFEEFWREFLVRFVAPCWSCWRTSCLVLQSSQIANLHLCLGRNACT